MSGTLAELEALEKAYNIGAKRVKYQDREIEYDTRENMLRRINSLKIELGLVDPQKPRRAQVIFDSGL